MAEDPPRLLLAGGRYEILERIAEGGMATVHLARMRGAAGFTLPVAIKRLRPELRSVRRFAEMFVDEARLAARVRHPNVVPVLDVVVEGAELFLVMDHVLGATLAELLGRARDAGERVPPRVAAGVVRDALEGLHAAHEARGERGEPLGLVHRDVAPQNILVGADGVARLLDFGVARADGGVHASTGGALKGTVAYMAPERLVSGAVHRVGDVYAAGVVLWEAITGQRPFGGAAAVDAVGEILAGVLEPPSRFTPNLPPGVDALVRRATSHVPEARFGTARDMGADLDDLLPCPVSAVSAWVQHLAAPLLAERAVQRLRALDAAVTPPPPPTPPPAQEVDVWKALAPPLRR
jgi:serine/threonine-protein kinase